MSRTIGVGLIGLGYMGRTHLAAWRAAQRDGMPCKVVAVADRSRERLESGTQSLGNLPIGAQELGLDLGGLFTTTDPHELFARADVQAVSICTPTDSHVELALAALAAKKHVLVEKPLALRAREIEPLLAAARAAGTLCMPAHCMRFWPGWDWLAERVRDRSLGAVKSAVFQRLGSHPSWSSIYDDPARTGGALVDLHIHDADIVRWLFGDPAEVTTTGSLDHVSTHYRYPGGPEHVLAEGGWNHASGFAFRMRYVVVFERGTADFDLTRTPQLTLARGGQAEVIPLAATSAYEAEVRHFLSAIAGGTRELRASVADGLGVARLLDAERESLETGRSVRLG